MKKILIFALVFALLGGAVVTAEIRLRSENNYYLQLDQSVYYPKDKKCKLPVVFFAHNGGADKSAWGDFPKQVADAGFFTVNFTYKSWDTTEVEAAIDYTLKKYADKIDLDNVSFVGGCHGGKDLLKIQSNTGLKYKVKDLVVLSVSEDDQEVKDAMKASHAPILVYYSKNDELGDYYKTVTKNIALNTITEP
ncbi:MAG TPA: hypothetical protein VF941_16830, partial [Clostridia bacterium]